MRRTTKTVMIAVVLVASHGADLFAGGQFESLPAPTEVYEFSQESRTTWTINLSDDSLFTQLGFSAGTSGDHGRRVALGPTGTEIRYRIVDTAAGTTDIVDLEGDQTGGGLVVGSSQVDFDLLIPSGQFSPPGVYEDLVTATLYAGLFSGLRTVDEAVVPISIRVPELLEVVLVDSGGAIAEGSSSGTLDFGELGDGIDDVQEIDLLARANVGYVVSVFSAHGGRMAHTDPAEPSTIPYDLLVDGQPRVFDTGAATISPAGGDPATDIAGRRYTLRFVVGSPQQSAAGLYQDTLTFTVTAR